MPRKLEGGICRKKKYKVWFLVETVLFIIAKTIAILLDVIYFAMLARVVLPFFVNPEESKLYALSALLSEPIIIPVRFLMVKLNIGQSSPIDWSFFVAAIGLSILQSFLPAI